MPRKDTPRFKAAYGWLRGEDWWGDPTSENRLLYDALMHPYARSASQTEPPDFPEDGDQYIVPAGATGDWENHEFELAMMVEGVWRFFKPIPGVRVRIADAGYFAWWDGEHWVPEPVSAVPDPEEGTRYDIALSVGYAPEPSETLLMLPIPQPMMLGKGAPGSLATILTPPPAGVQLSIARNGAQVGTITYTSSSFSGIIAVPTDVMFAAGDRLRVYCPLTVPNNFRDFGAVLRFTLL